MMVRAKVKADRVAEVEAAAKRMFSAIEEAQPQGARYASCPEQLTVVGSYRFF
jgi:hypothetical protein